MTSFVPAIWRKRLNTARHDRARSACPEIFTRDSTPAILLPEIEPIALGLDPVAGESGWSKGEADRAAGLIGARIEGVRGWGAETC